MRKLTVLVFAIAVAMVVAVAACGSEDPTATPRVSQPTTAPVVETPMAEDPTATPRPQPTARPRTAPPVVAVAVCGDDYAAVPQAQQPAGTSDDDMDDDMDDMDDDMDDMDDDMDDMDDDMGGTGEMQTVVFSDLSWDSAQIQNRIAQYIVEKGYGYPTDVLYGDTLPLLQGLRNGDTHVTMEIWLPNQNDAWVDALAEGSVQEVGFSLGPDWQSSFVIPRYLQEEHPELDTVADLQDPDCKELFSRPESEGKAFLVSCVVGWACEGVNDAQIEGYGLTDHVFVSKPGSGAALNADLYGKYERQEPWLGYQYGTNAPAFALDLVRLQEPAYTDECWDGLQAFVDGGPPPTMGCAYRDADIRIAVRTDLIESAPELIALFQSWNFDIPQYGTVILWREENTNADVADSALWWLTTSEEEWSTWVTDEAAEGIRTALAANEIPDGWPTE